MDEKGGAEILTAIEEAMRSFEEAERALDAERLIGHFAGGDDHYIFNDGHRVTHEAMAAGVRGAFATLRSIEGGFNNVDVMVVGPDAALVAATFAETVTTNAGARMQQRGVASWLWRRVAGESSTVTWTTIRMRRAPAQLITKSYERRQVHNTSPPGPRVRSSWEHEVNTRHESAVARLLPQLDLQHGGRR